MNVFQHRFKTAIIAAVAALAALLATVSAGEAANNKGMATIPLTLINKSGHRGKMFVMVYGQLGSTWYVVTNKKGDVAALPDSNTYRPYGLNVGRKKKLTIRVPELMHSRVYVSFGKKLQLISPGGAPTPTSGWSKLDQNNDTNPNFYTLFDWFEYSWGPQPAPVPPLLPANATYINGNQTQVDMFGIPMLFTFVGVDANNKVSVLKGGFSSAKARKNIFTALRRAGAPWHSLVVDPHRGIPLRAISPYNGISMGTFPSNQLDSYIDQVWAKYTGATAAKTLIANTTGPTQNFTGQVSGTSLVFTRSTGGTATFSKPTTMQAYQAWAPTVSDPGDGDLVTGAGEIETYVQAALLRSTMLVNNDIGTCPSKTPYYRYAPVDQYSKIIHQYAYKHLAYGFGYDDHCNQGSDQQVFQPRKVILRIQALNK